MTIDIRDVIRDNYGRLGIVIREEPAPGRRWLAEQADPRVRALGTTERWLGVMPFAGGLVIVPESLCEWVRPAGQDDVAEVLQVANSHGAQYLCGLFPEFTRARF